MGEKKQKTQNKNTPRQISNTAPIKRQFCHRNRFSVAMAAKGATKNVVFLRFCNLETRNSKKSVVK